MKKSIILVLILLFHTSVSYSQTISGCLVDDLGNGKAGMELKAFIHPDVFTAVSAPNGTFSLKITTGLENQELPSGYKVSENHPNPFSFITGINVTIPSNGNVSCDIFNVQGQKVKESSNFRCGPGVHNLDIDFQGLTDGFYLLKIMLDDRYSVSRKVWLKQGSPNSSSQILPVAGLRLNTPKQENAVIKIDSLVVTGADVERKVFVDVDNIVDNILDLGDINISEALSIEEDDFENSYAPLAITGVSGSGFDTKNMALRYFDNRGFAVTIPAVYSTDEFMICSLPAYVNITTGEIESGVVKVQAVKDLGKLSITSNIKSGIGIGALPALTLPPGTIASNFYASLELMLADEITSLENMDQTSGGVINTVQLRSEFENSRLLCVQMVDKIRQVMNGQIQNELAGDINGTKVYLNTASLQILDQWLLAVVNGISPETTDTPSGIIEIEKRQTLPYILKKIANEQDIDDLLRCNVNGSYNSNCVQDYRQQKLPAARDQLATLGKMVGYGTFAIGAGLALTVGSVPLSVVALLALPNLMILGTMMQMDATVLSMNYDDINAAKRLLDDFTDGVKTVANGVISPVISAWKGDKAGVFYDFLTTFESELKTLVSGFVTQSLSYIQFKPEPVTYTGTLNGVQIEESEKATVTYTITSTVKITLSGNGTLIYPYGGKIVVTGNVAPTAVSHPPWQVTVTGGPFTLPGSVYGTQSNVSGTISKYVVFSNGTVNENSLTGNISFTVGCGWVCADPIKQSITLNK
ncbi:MAG: T9SS type A sorting domain-containing protein [Bacteroidia bacterium]|nr:T9SS type A sorting domain-containing protein [Bacteroidia bacterium]